jgi:uncharacterized membrane protein YdjX (TVP38/TMEM64 family)
MRSTRSRLAALLALAVLIAALPFLLPVKDSAARFLDWLEGLGEWGPLAVGLAYIPACIFFFPGSILTLGAGFLFGVPRGGIAVYAGAVIGAAAAFWVGRTLARGWIAERISRNPKFKVLDEAVAAQGLKIVLLTRLSPLFPFNLLNYAFGITQVRFRDYLLASAAGMLPGTLMYVYIGSGLKNAAEIFSGQASRKPEAQLLFYTGLIVTVILTLWITRIARKALSGKLPERNAGAADEN